MREILFRGKAYYGEWVEGTYYHETEFYGDDCDYHYIIRTKDVLEDNMMSYDEVIPETVGQYTGLTDKNGKKIFEGDIVKTQPFYDRPYSKNRKSKHFVGIVEYKVRTFGGNSFYPKQAYQGEWGLKFIKDFGRYTHYSWGELWDCEVIGNIHDNPELLKGGVEE